LISRSTGANSSGGPNVVIQNVVPLGYCANLLVKDTVFAAEYWWLDVCLQAFVK
jgi:hypothetical protein